MHSSLLARCLVAAAIASSAAAHAQSSLYRWVDRDGKVQYTDTPPPADARGATQKRFGSAADEPQVPFATQAATRRNPVMLWVAPQCEPCSRGRQLLAERGVPFSERDVQSNIETQRAFRELAGDLNVPLLEVGTSRIKGFEEGQWNAALDGAGYPKERAYGQPPSRPSMANLPPAPPKDPAAEAAAKPQ